MKPYYFEVLDGVRRNRGDDWTSLSHEEKCLLVGALLMGLKDMYRTDFVDQMLNTGGIDMFSSHLFDPAHKGPSASGSMASFLVANMEQAAIETYGPDIAYDLEHPGEPSQFAGQFKDLA